MKRPVILDCDGVLLDWETAFAAWLKKHYGLDLDPAGPQQWDLWHWVGRSREETMFLVARFNQTEDFAQLAPMPGAVEVVQALWKEGHPLFVLTSCDSKAKDRRTENLARVFGRWIIDKTPVICLDLGESKDAALGAFSFIHGPCHWVEDNYKNALLGYLAGHHAFLIKRPHNRDHHKDQRDGIKRLDLFSDLLSHIA